jgi:hypothetical protein
VREGGQVWWDVPMSALGSWDPKAVTLYIPGLEPELTLRMVHDIAYLALARKAMLRFKIGS